MATSVTSFLDRRIDPGTLPMAVGDIVVLAALLTFGVVQHNGVSYLSSNLVGVVLILLPFFVGWVIAAPLIGAYSPGARESAKAAIPLAIRSWIPADIIGTLLRASPLFEGGAPLVFILVTLAVGLVGLTAWRWTYFKLR